jgi:hypothetical protein
MQLHRPEPPVAGRVPEVILLIGGGDEDATSRPIYPSPAIGWSGTINCL